MRSHMRVLGTTEVKPQKGNDLTSYRSKGTWERLLTSPTKSNIKETTYDTSHETGHKSLIKQKIKLMNDNSLTPPLTNVNTEEESPTGSKDHDCWEGGQGSHNEEGEGAHDDLRHQPSGGGHWRPTWWKLRHLGFEEHRKVWVYLLLLFFIIFNTL